MRERFERLKQKAMQLSLPIPITAAMIQQVITKYPVEGVTQLQVTLKEGHFVVTGTARKLAVNVDFTIVLQPVRAEGRQLFFQVVNFKPLSFEMVKKKALHHPPMLNYANDEISLDLNTFEGVRKVPFGEIRDIAIKDDAAWVKIGL